MAVPEFQTFMRPTLAAIADGKTHSAREVREAVCQEIGLSEVDLAETLNSGQTKHANRFAWAVTHMFKAGLLERPERAHLRITLSGLNALEENPSRVDRSVLLRYDSYKRFTQRHKETPQLASSQSQPEVSGDLSPAEMLSDAERTNVADVSDELLQRTLALEPRAFEKLVLDLLKAMGYGVRGSISETPRSGDGGIDGIVNQDKLGLDRIYMQAKKYAIENPVDRPKLQSFVGALASAQGNKGVFITTSYFTNGAKDEAERVLARIVLIDGPKLMQLMIAHGVGVQPEQRAMLYRVDEDFFEDY